MKNALIIFMNVLFILVVAADVVAVKFECNTAPQVQTSCYQELQAHQPTTNLDVAYAF